MKNDVHSSHADQDDIDAGTFAFPQSRPAHHQQTHHISQQTNAAYHGDQDPVDDELIPDLLNKVVATAQSSGVGVNLCWSAIEIIWCPVAKV